jgi:hypothetical protein
VDVAKLETILAGKFLIRKKDREKGGEGDR